MAIDTYAVRMIVWDVTYACPLRCLHCYSESGRRPPGNTGTAELMRIADAIIAMRPESVLLAGGEPLTVKGIFDAAQRISDSGSAVVLYTSGWGLHSGLLDRLGQTCSEIHVSVDGATADVHDRIRGRAGSFDRAMRALHLLDGTNQRFGIDYAVMRSNLDQVDLLCSRVVPQFTNLSFVSFGAVVPSGLASHASFAEHELLTDPQTQGLVSAQRQDELAALLPPTVQLSTTDNRDLQMHPDLLARIGTYPLLQIEPDGAVRAMPIYEGTIGNVLTDPPDVLRRRSAERMADPFVAETLRSVQTMRDWAGAVRAIDYRFGSDAVRKRIDSRPPFEAR